VVPLSEFLPCILIRSIDRNLKFSRRVTDLCLSQGRWLLRACAGGTVSSKEATHSSSSFIIRVGNQCVGSSSIFLHIPIFLIPIPPPTLPIVSRLACSAGSTNPTVPIASAQRAGRLCSRREARAACTTRRSRRRHAA